MSRINGRILSLAIAAAAVLGLAAPASAGEPHLLSLGVGYYDITGSHDDAADFRLEYRSGWGLWLWPSRVITKPFLGVAGTTSGSFFGGGGVLFDMYLTERIVATASIGAFGYVQGGSDLDLGHPLEFRTQGELSYRFRNRSRLGVAFSHYSNLGIGDTNPGTEVLTLYYHLPLDWLGVRLP
ncbi:MAG: acyloxyacyl hydrolase [Rhodospirillales bacterium]|nr:MAG: acyloxyacyl hydrolase [Rhodospirillales bacterium]